MRKPEAVEAADFPCAEPVSWWSARSAMRGVRWKPPRSRLIRTNCRPRAARVASLHPGPAATPPTTTARA